MGLHIWLVKMYNQYLPELAARTALLRLAVCMSKYILNFFLIMSKEMFKLQADICVWLCAKASDTAESLSLSLSAVGISIFNQWSHVIQLEVPMQVLLWISLDSTATTLIVSSYSRFSHMSSKRCFLPGSFELKLGSLQKLENTTLLHKRLYCVFILFFYI